MLKTMTRDTFIKEAYRQMNQLYVEISNIDSHLHKGYDSDLYSAKTRKEHAVSALKNMIKEFQTLN